MDVVDFFLGPYREASTGMILLEIIAAVMGIVSVYYAKQEDIKVYPTGLISTMIYIFICYRFSLYGDTIINLYYSAMSIYGWYMWMQGGESSPDLPITRMNNTDTKWSLGIFLFTAVFTGTVYSFYGRLENAVSVLDIFTTSVFFVAMWLMANKKLEHWLFWIMGNVISVPLYFYKGLAFTGVQYGVFLILAIQGWQTWREDFRKQASPL